MGRLVLSRNDMLALMSQLIVWKQDWPDIWFWGSYEKSFAGLCPQLTIVMRDHFFANTGIFCVFYFSRKSLTLFDPSADNEINNLYNKRQSISAFPPSPYYRLAGCRRSCWRRLERHSPRESQETQPTVRPGNQYFKALYVKEEKLKRQLSKVFFHIKIWHRLCCVTLVRLPSWRIWLLV